MKEAVSSVYRSPGKGREPVEDKPDADTEDRLVLADSDSAALWF